MIKTIFKFFGADFLEGKLSSELLKKVHRQSKFQTFLLLNGIPQSDEVEICMYEQPHPFWQGFFFFLDL